MITTRKSQAARAVISPCCEPTSRRVLAQIAAKSLDAVAGFFEQLVRCRIGYPEEWRHSERRTMHDGDAFGLQKLAGEILIRRNHLAALRLLADQLANA